MQTRFFVLIGILAIALLLGDVVGAKFELYLDFWWFDIVMHILGGAVVGGLCAAIYVRVYRPISVRKVFLVSILAAGCIGIGWEFFEWYFDLIYTTHYVFDTVVDLLMDLVGGFFIIRTAQKYGLLI